MTKNAELIKEVVQRELAKTGHTLSDFEANLKKLSLEKNAGMDGFLLSLSPEHFSGLASNFANIGGVSAIGLGLAGAVGGYKGYEQLANSDDNIDKKQHEADEYKRALHSLMAARQQNQLA